MEEKRIDYTGLGQERVVSIKELIFECLRKWWIIGIVALVFAGLFGGYKYQKDAKYAQEKAVTSEKKEEVDIESLKAELSEEEILDADNVIHLKKSMIQIKEYLDNSILMQVNPYAENVAVMQYYIDNDYKIDYNGVSNKDNSLDLNMAYETYVSDGSMVIEIQKQLLKDVDAKVVSELITFETSSDNSFMVKVVGRTQEECKELSEQIKNLLNTYKGMVSEKVGIHQLKLVSDSYNVVVDNNVINSKISKINTIQDFRNKVKTVEMDMGDMQKSYINAQFEEEEANILEEEMPTEVVVPQVHISKKYVVVGAFAGVILAVGVIVFIYLMKGTINSAENIQYLYNLKILGKVGKGKVFSRDMRSLEEQLKFTMVNIKCSVDLQQAQKVYVCGSCLEKLNPEVIEQIRTKAEQLKLAFDFGNNFLYEPESLEKMLSCDSVILLEKEGSTKYSDLVNEYQICMEYQKNILGVVMFR